jgi:hypothetical protein
MHCCHLGVARQFAKYWFDTSIFLTKNNVEFISKNLMKIKPPRQICRLPRPLEERAYWKAREWENWILFYSIPLLRNVLEAKYLRHWALFVESLYMLTNDSITRDELNVVELLLCEFVCETQVLYGRTAMTRNVHLLNHLAQTVANWGPLWACDAFPFETENGKLIRRIKSAKGIPFQICRQIAFDEAISMIHENMRPLCQSVSQFLDKLNAKVMNAIKFHNIVFLEPCNLEALNITTFLFSPNTRFYKKIIKDNCIYRSASKCNIRSDDSYALLNNGNYVRIKGFAVDIELNHALAIINKLNINNNNNNQLCKRYLKKINKENDIEQVISIISIVKNCIYISVQSTEYISPCCNIYHY